MTEYCLLAGQLFNGISVASILSAGGARTCAELRPDACHQHGSRRDINDGRLFDLRVIEVLPHGIGYPIGLVAGVCGHSGIRRSARTDTDTTAIWASSGYPACNLGCQPDYAAGGAVYIRSDWRRGYCAALARRMFNISGGAFQGFGLPLVRLFIIALSAAVLTRDSVLIARTRMGLLVQAVHQDRDMAEALGINTRNVDLASLRLAVASRDWRVSACFDRSRDSDGWSELYRICFFSCHPGWTWQRSRNGYRGRHGWPVFRRSADIHQCQHLRRSVAGLCHRLYPVPAARNCDSVSSRALEEA